MWNLSVPKIMHTYWGGDILSYMRFLTIKSFIKYNPDWEVWVWMPDKVTKKVTWASRENDYKLVCNNFLPVLLTLPIKVIRVNFEADALTAQMAEVHRADYIRIKCMYEYGGLWSDMDIIYFAPVENMNLNKYENRNISVFPNICEYGHSTGFVMATKGSHFFRKLYDSIPSNFNPTHYQCIGPIMFNKYFPTIESIPSAVNIPMNVVYKYNFNCVKSLLSEKISKFDSGSIGCHWYGGNTLWEPFIKETNGGFMNLPNNVIGNLIKSV